jgi:hypothetical protein
MKNPFSKGQRARNCQAPPARQNDFRTFCMSEETERLYHKLEEVIDL